MNLSVILKMSNFNVYFYGCAKSLIVLWWDNSCLNKCNFASFFPDALSQAVTTSCIPDLTMSTKDKVFDPFCKDSGRPAVAGKAEKSSFNPSVSPFTPSADLTSWEVVAAEYTGKAVAVMQGEGRLLVCTSPAFNSKCRHPGISCLDWDNVRLAPAHGSQPDSGLDNTDQSSEERDRIARVAQWSADAARQTEAAKGNNQSVFLLLSC